MSLYNCKADGDQYRISKFTNDLDVEASYLTSNDECDCPAGHRPVCRHRIMLPRFIAKNATAGQWFHNYEANQWIRAASDDEPDTLGDLASAASEVDDNIVGYNQKAIEAERQCCEMAQPINLLELAEVKASITKTFTLGGFPYECFDFNCTTQNECILNGCAKGHGQPRFDKDYSNSIGHSPVHDALPPKPLRRL